mmetsp:Transcript_33195/g.87239  ORF Transcript_33195/g.87239 Transcript_33195/m.87239 type:complete len:124 (+) Transcript_33195:79-450(+)
MSWFKKKGHKRLESRDADASDDTFEAISASWTFTEGVMAEAIGLQLSSGNVVQKVEKTSPFASKFKMGDTIISVNSLECSASVGMVQLLESELEANGPQFELVAFRARAGTKFSGFSDESAEL